MNCNLNIKEVILTSEKEKVINFLNKFTLSFEDDVIKTYYIEIENEIIATASCSKSIIKDVAINSLYQGKNIASLLINKIIDYLRTNLVYSYQVYTKKEYEETFINLGFRKIISTENVVLLEGGVDDINQEINKIKKQIEIRFAPLDKDSDLAVIVINGNPFTLGHEYLVSVAANEHKMVVVFILEEDKSEISFKERLSMAYLATKKYSNVLVLPSTKYIISDLTFPTYFLKKEEINKERSLIDVLIFKEYFMNNLFIKKRYVGSEVKHNMIEYNNILKEILKDDLVLIPRLNVNDNVVSASYVRELLKDGNINAALEYCPRECAMILQLIGRNYGH